MEHSPARNPYPEAAPVVVKIRNGGRATTALVWMETPDGKDSWRTVLRVPARTTLTLRSVELPSLPPGHAVHASAEHKGVAVEVSLFPPNPEPIPEGAHFGEGEELFSSN
jgi:hypothetical protein